MEKSESISVSFKPDEALVLFELAIRLKQKSDLLLGEREVLNHMECALERRLAEPFLPNYSELVMQARTRLAIQKPD